MVYTRLLRGKGQGKKLFGVVHFADLNIPSLQNEQSLPERSNVRCEQAPQKWLIFQTETYGAFVSCVRVEFTGEYGMPYSRWRITKATIVVMARG
jgi:hypothetical protein